MRVVLKLNKRAFESLVLLYETSNFVYSDYDAMDIDCENHIVNIDRDICFKLLTDAVDNMVASKTNYMQNVVNELFCKLFNESPYNYTKNEWKGGK
tara:strand:+ start:1675 stop:1962 length:288 start_codon:yes stop_codon:yes gene_type:complete